MTPSKLLNLGIVPAFIELERQGITDSLNARRFVLAIALQESSLMHRRQVAADGTENGPAASFWQFEQGGGCKGVLGHQATSKAMLSICESFNITPTPAGLWEAMRYNDIVAAAAARLLVYTLPKSLPDSSDSGWMQYLSAWRPGKPHPERWAGNWAQASIITGAK